MSNLETKRKDRFRAARPPSLAKLPIKMAVAVMALIALPLAAYMVYDAYRYFKQEVAEVENSILQEKKIISRITVEDILSDIYYRRFQAEQRFKRTLRDDVEKDIQQEVLLRIKKFHSGRGNTLMIFDSNGSVIADAALFPDDVRAFVEQVDDSGRKPVEKAMEQASADKEGTYLQVCSDRPPYGRNSAQNELCPRIQGLGLDGCVRGATHSDRRCNCCEKTPVGQRFE